MYELMIVGGGPAGMTAAVYAARKLLNTLLITSDIGGQVNWTNGVENYMGYQFIEGGELVTKFEQQVDQFPIDRKIGEKVTLVSRIDGGFEVVSEAGNKYQGKAVVLASGKRPRRLSVDGEMRLTGHGVTYCSICDGPIFAGSGRGRHRRREFGHRSGPGHGQDRATRRYRVGDATHRRPDHDPKAVGRR